jgi:hypothetical protein
MPQENQTAQETDTEDISMKAMDDLLKWRRMALRGKDKAHEFVSEYIPSSVMVSVKSRIASLTDKAVIAGVFDTEIEKMKPKPKIDPLVILRGIELGVKAMEMKG